MRKLVGKCSYILLLMLAFAFVFSSAVSAAAAEGGSITWSTNLEAMPEDVHFYLYRVGNVAEDQSYQLTGVFADLSEKIDINKLRNDDQTAVETLEAYAKVHGTPDMTGLADHGGTVQFRVPEDGLYLVTSDTSEQFQSTPSLLAIPYMDENSSEEKREVTIDGKASYMPTQLEQPIQVSVEKIWLDHKGHKLKKHPDNVKVKLYVLDTSGGKPRDITSSVLTPDQPQTVTLNDENNWTYTWAGDNLTNSHREYRVEELMDGNSGYHQVVSNFNTKAHSYHYVITNTLKKAAPPPVKVTPAKVRPRKLPQTGQLWWPVAILMIGGMLFIVVGLTLRRRGDR
jgi:hypothetical protein